VVWAALFGGLYSFQSRTATSHTLRLRQYTSYVHQLYTWRAGITAREEIERYSSDVN